MNWNDTTLERRLCGRDYKEVTPAMRYRWLEAEAFSNEVVRGDAEVSRRRILRAWHPEHST